MKGSRRRQVAVAPRLLWQNVAKLRLGYGDGCWPVYTPWHESARADRFRGFIDLSAVTESLAVGIGLCFLTPRTMVAFHMARHCGF
jgi:hypothetical protein